MVIRDLTLRSAASFGSFHLIRLLYDEYMFYLVEHRVAQATGETPIAVMGEVRQGGLEAQIHPDTLTLAQVSQSPWNSPQSSSRLSLTPSPGDPASSSGLCRLLHTHT